MRRLLLSNDDGVHAPGLRALHDALAPHARLRVVAPDRDKSGASNSLTLSRPLSLTDMDNGFYSVDGTPADCVYLGVNGVWDEKPRKRTLPSCFRRSKASCIVSERMRSTSSQEWMCTRST